MIQCDMAYISKTVLLTMYKLQVHCACKDMIYRMSQTSLYICAAFIMNIPQTELLHVLAHKIDL